MIIGVDHIALSTVDIQKAVRALMNWGYKPCFIDMGSINDPIKGPYLNAREEFHDIAYCQPLSRGVAVELTVHSGRFTGEYDSAYKVIFSGENPGGNRDNTSKEDIENCAVISEAFAGAAQPIRLQAFDTDAYYLNEEREGQDNRVAVKAALSYGSDIEESVDFWGNFGFTKKSSARERWELLEFKNQAFGWGFNLLIAKPRHKISKDNYRIDNAGFNCLAFLTSNIRAEKERLKKKRIETTDIFSFRAGGRLLRICLCRGNNGEPVELIEIDSKGETHEEKIS